MNEFSFKLNGKDYKTSVEEKAEGSLTVTVNGKAYQVEVPVTHASAPRIVRPSVAPIGAAPVAQRPAAAATAENITSPLPGTIIEIKVKEGEKVKRGQVLVVMEAMKMANDIVADHDGTINKIMVKVGENVTQGAVLVAMEGAPEAPAAPVAAPAAAPVAGGPQTVVAPLPGTVKQIKVKPGDKVKRGDVVLTMEAMKMENNICAEGDGTVKSVHVHTNQQVNQGDVLVDIA